MYKIYYCDTNCVNEFKSDIKDVKIAKAIANCVSMNLNTISFVYDTKNKEIICDINSICIKDDDLDEECECHHSGGCNCGKCHHSGGCSCDDCQCDNED